jgi:tripartite-type tricarboxylate transporter receptor subunit TctC
MLRSSLIKNIVGLFALINLTNLLAQPYPTKPIRLSVGYAPGGSTDVVARIFGQRLSDAIGQPVVIENRPGAGGAIAADLVAKAEPDGHRILMLGTGTLNYSVLTKNVPYNMLKDFTPITYVAASPQVLVVSNSIPSRSVGELIQLARSKPGELTYGSEGIGGIAHLAAAQFSLMTGTQLSHVPFKGAIESTVAIAGGQIDMNIPNLTSALPLLKADKFRALAVTGLKRSSLLPSIPTLDESGLKGYEVLAWFGFVGPAGMPKSVVERLNMEFIKIANLPEVKEALAKQAMDVQIRPPEEFAAFLRETAMSTVRLANDVKLKME